LRSIRRSESSVRVRTAVWLVMSLMVIPVLVQRPQPFRFGGGFSFGTSHSSAYRSLLQRAGEQPGPSTRQRLLRALTDAGRATSLDFGMTRSFHDADHNNIWIER
jgi:hypothetical protein